MEAIAVVVCAVFVVVESSTNNLDDDDVVDVTSFSALDAVEVKSLSLSRSSPSSDMLVFFSYVVLVVK